MTLPTEWKDITICIIYSRALQELDDELEIINTYVWSWTDCEKQADKKIFKWP